MDRLKRYGVDGYMLLLIGMVTLGAVLPAQGMAAGLLSEVTFWAVALLFFLYGARLDPSAVAAGMLNWRLQLLIFLTTFALFPLLGIGFGAVFGGLIGPELALGLLFLSVLPSTVQSSIAFTAMAGGNVPGAICAASLSNLIGVVLTPLLATVVLHREGGGASLDAVLRIATQILLPFLVGQALRPWIGGWIRARKGLTMVVDRGSILLIVYSAFSAGTVAGIWGAMPPATLLGLALVIALYLGVVMGAMAGGGRLFGLPEADRAALFFCGSTKSLASGLPIAVALFPAESVGVTVLPLMLFHLIQLFVCALLAQRAAHRQAVAGGP